MKVRLEQEELYTVINALNHSAEEYERHAAEFDTIAKRLAAGESIGGWADGEDGVYGARRLRDQFKRQTEQARTLAQKLEEQDDGT